MFIFRRLKINHDIHEFILDSGTVTNNNCIPHRNDPKFLLCVGLALGLIFLPWDNNFFAGFSIKDNKFFVVEFQPLQIFTVRGLPSNDADEFSLV